MNTAEKHSIIGHWPKNLKKTVSRQKVASILENAQKPLCASEVYLALSAAGEKINLSTVYRTLEAFTEAGLAEKTTVSGNTATYYEIKGEQHSHYAVCLKCQKLIKLKSCPLNHDIDDLDQSGFAMTGHRVEIYGYCKNCKETEKNK